MSETTARAPIAPLSDEELAACDGVYDFIIVGSGAGGGPLAARLARGGRKVLVLEAGGDAATAPPSPAFPGSTPGEVHRVPGYHGAATEDPHMAWMFSVRHYEDRELQMKDEKFNRSVDPNSPPGETAGVPERFLDAPGKNRRQGIFYPRSTGIGGCTGHHAMIVIAPNDRDWDHIADLTGDESWRAGAMRGYFTKLENCLYLDAYDKKLRQLLGWIHTGWRTLAGLVHPRSKLDRGGHGDRGWQPTSFIDPDLVHAIARTDRTFFRVLARTIFSVLHGDRSLVWKLKRALLRARVIEHLDPNDHNTRLAKPEGVFLIPAGIGGPPIPTSGNGNEGGGKGAGKAAGAKGNSGHRRGVREFLLETIDWLEAHPEGGGRLKILTGLQVTRVLLEDTAAPAASRATGVEFATGPHLYEASPLWDARDGASVKRRELRVRENGEVILAGGAFNTPQLLMLSGIGDRDELAAHGIRARVHLPGVGKNLQDRYEVTIISELEKPFGTLDTVSFRPGDPDDRARARWLEDGTGLYGTNGGALAVLRRSAALRDDEPEADTFTFGAPAAFRGYYWNWSRELLKPAIGARGEQRNLWTWVILKAYTGNNAGTVRLVSADPFRFPEICFRSFAEGPPEAHVKDLAAVVDTVKFFRKVNARHPGLFATEIQPGKHIPDDSDAMRDWVRSQAWGHHACGTCRMGADPWRSDARLIKDPGAVLDSKFRVHGVSGLRVVDASVFPKIPGYFILAPILMVSEKAADVLLAAGRGDESHPDRAA